MNAGGGEVRYRTTGRFVWETFEGLAVLFGTLLTWPVSKTRLTNWGSRPDERAPRLGDRFVTSPERIYPRAIAIDAPPERVWPWLVQFGLGRAGFYSYEAFERLVRIPVRNVESVIPELQSLAIGDEIKLHPDAPGIRAVAIDAARHLCFGEEPGTPITGESLDPRRSWSMYLDPSGVGGCRLVLRGCIEPVRERTLAKRVEMAFDAPIDFVMEQRMLRTIKRLAEER